VVFRRLVTAWPSGWTLTAHQKIAPDLTDFGRYFVKLLRFSSHAARGGVDLHLCDGGAHGAPVCGPAAGRRSTVCRHLFPCNPGTLSGRSFGRFRRLEHAAFTCVPAARSSMCWIARFSAFGDAASTHRALKCRLVPSNTGQVIGTPTPASGRKASATKDRAMVTMRWGGASVGSPWPPGS